MAQQDGRVLENGNIVTLDPRLPRAHAIAIGEGRILGVWAGGAPAGTVGRRVDLGGATVLPGLVDAHLHLGGLGGLSRQLDLRGSRSLNEVLARVRIAVAATPTGQWLRGEGWDQNNWPDADYPSAAALDEISADHPVWLRRVDGHAVWLNSVALRLIGIFSTTAAPPGGEIHRDANGKPSGILIDTAMELAAQALPTPSEAEVENNLREGLRRCAAVGLTAVHDMGTSAPELGALRRLAATGELPLRVYVYADLNVDLRGVEREVGLLRIVGRKLYADGALGSHGAALREAYADRSQTRGLLVHEPAALGLRVREVAAEGLQVAIHAIGDRAVDVALEALGGLPDGHHRHRLEHLQVLGRCDAERLAAAGVVASMQPVHATSDRPWLESRLGDARLRYAYAWQTLLCAGVTLAFGSDAPVESENPWLGVHAAVTRQDAAGQPPGGWQSAERLSVEQALMAYTRGAAQAVGEASGVIAVGQPADLSLVDRDPLSIPAAQLRVVRALGTWVAGHEQGGARELAPITR